ncbi:MAG: Eco47II family restriction endonuclease, partial [Patescibacteria group bacterium]
RPANKSIRVVDGKTFYGIATGDKKALKKLYEALPTVISEILGHPLKSITEDKLFTELFEKIY